MFYDMKKKKLRDCYFEIDLIYCVLIFMCLLFLFE